MNVWGMVIQIDWTWLLHNIIST